jgi:hypothetical protein
MLAVADGLLLVSVKAVRATAVHSVISLGMLKAALVVNDKATSSGLDKND